MNINVLYFASFADKAQKSHEVLTLDKGMGLPDLYAMLHDKYQFSLDASRIRVAINDEFAEWTDTIKDGDSVVFIPPVAGG